MILTKQSATSYYLFQYTVDQLVTWTEDGSCTTSKLDQNAVANLIGYVPVAHGVHIPSARDVFKFGRNFTQTFEGKARVRGIPVDHWKSCQEWSAMKANYTLDYYFTRYGNWLPASENANIQSPVRAEVAGVITNGDGSINHSFHHVYEYHSFTETLPKDPDPFQLPAGLYCPGYIPVFTRPFPTIPEMFVLSTETILPNGREVIYTKMWYSITDKIVRVSEKFTSANSNPVSTVYDFDRGLSYTIDDLTGNCKVGFVEPDSPLSAPNSGAQLRMISAKEYFFAEIEPSEIYYTGTRVVRGVTCDTWIGQYKDDATGKTYIVEWYFTEAMWSVIEATSVAKERNVLFKIIQKERDHPENVKIINVESLVEMTSFDWTSIDITPCFSYANRTTFSARFFIGSQESDLDAIGFEIAKRKIHKNLTELTNISPLRLTEMQIDYDGKDYIFFVATLLQKAPLANPQAYNTKPEPTLHGAFKVIQEKISSKSPQFKILISGPGKTILVLLQGDSAVVVTYAVEPTALPTPPTPSQLPPTPSTTYPTPSPIKETTSSGSMDTTTETKSTLTTSTKTPEPTKSAITSSTLSSVTPKPCTVPTVTAKPCTCPTYTKNTCAPCPTVTHPPTPTPKIVTKMVTVQVPCPTETDSTTTVLPTTASVVTPSAADVNSTDNPTNETECDAEEYRKLLEQRNRNNEIGPGAVAGIALGMLCVGLLLGFVASRVACRKKIYKRNKRESIANFINDQYNEDATPY
ncbi:uncharacterized protein LOC106154932 isoform X2 [Lingula anatina]|nr:uncharacterized protein LOC106154932 isoform X2 [Lingula anatina]|eukprot:XP_013384950.1 uncharacterized protein LOC106154932 isoform X2 [Lingula anatina]